MSGFDGRISVDGDAAVDDELIGAAIKHADKIRAWKDTSGVRNMIRAYHLGNGYHAVVADLEYSRSIHISTPSAGGFTYTGINDFYIPGANILGVPDVVSGKTIQPYIVTEDKVDVLKNFTPTEKTENRYTDLERRRRLAIEEDPMFSMYWTGSETHSEHSHSKPANFTGAMRRLVQLLLGVGFVSRPTYEQKLVKESNGAFKYLLTSSFDPPVSSAYGLYEQVDKDTSPPKIVVAYDYRFAVTNGIAFDSGHNPWVVEISARGVHVMPLYMDPLSLTEKGKKRYIDVSPELKDFLDEFGGFPLGYNIPTGNSFAALKRAGEIVELVNADDMAEFYGKTAYSSICGWSFNDAGTEAHNTCYDFWADGFSTGYHYGINFKLSHDTIPELRIKTRAVITGLRLSSFWEVNKAARMSDEEAEGILRTLQTDASSARAQFDALTVTPSLMGTATLNLVRSGRLYHPGMPNSQPQIKYPEPFIGGLASFDFGPLEGHASASGIKCNTPMYAAFIGNELDVVYYFYNPVVQKPKTVNTRRMCQYEGDWEEYSTGLNPEIYGNFYSRRIDARAMYGTNSYHSSFEGTFVGQYNYAVRSMPFSRCINVYKFRDYAVSEHRELIGNRSVRISVAIPFHDRSAYYMMQHHSKGTGFQSDALRLERAYSATWQTYVVYNWAYHWIGCDLSDGVDADCIARKLAQERRPDGAGYVDAGFYAWGGSTYCFDEAPDDMHYAVCPAGTAPKVVSTSWGSSILGSAIWPAYSAPAQTYTQTTVDPEYTFRIDLVSNSGHGVVKAKSGTTNEYEAGYSGWWFTASPSNIGVAYIAETHSCLGSNVMNYMDDIYGNTKGLGGPESMQSVTNVTYTGVIE